MNSAIPSSATWIPIIAILATFAVPIVAIIMDFRRRRLQFEERRAMIERGMQPPPVADNERSGGTPEERREGNLKSGLIMLFLGVGLGLGAYLLMYVVTDTFIPRRMGGTMALAASIVGFIGLGKLMYHAVSRKGGGGEGTAP